MGISNEEAIEALMKFGLSKEEAEIYLLLVENQSMTVRELNQRTPSIQRTYLYNFLDKLARNGWVHIDTLTKPQSYNPYDVDLEEKLKEKEDEIQLMQEEFDLFKKNTFPKLKNYLNSLFEKSSLKKISTPYKEYFQEFFKNEKIRVDYTTYQTSLNPFLSFLLMNCEFHGFHIFHHTKPMSTEHVIHFYVFSDKNILKDSEKMILELLNWRKEEINKFIIEQGNIIQLENSRKEILTNSGKKINLEIIPFIDKEVIYESILVYPFILNEEENLIYFQFSNKAEKGKELLDWLLNKINQNNNNKK
ncbi:MAG: hypothetical protein EAX96_17645 [Candidatus Lokiarchaeota archaeon]|nr:hypothetical protein [Candidatus Lokiarchaeota archaeon]